MYALQNKTCRARILATTTIEDYEKLPWFVTQRLECADTLMGAEIDRRLTESEEASLIQPQP